jgi:anti-sigma regulatory factor (Ser/Thr protein kinase)
LTELPNVFIRVSNGAHNIALVRQALSGVADRLELAPGVINDVRTAATEACNNVALHAYRGDEGPLEVEIGCRSHALEVVVRDHGTGIRPRIRAQSESALGIGIAIIQALARRVEFNYPPEGGTEVRMEFAARPVDGLTKVLHSVPRESPAEGLASTTVLAIAPAQLAQSVLPRVLALLGAHASLTTDRISDLLLISDAVVSQARETAGGDEVRLVARVQRRRIELALGPLPDGAATALLAASCGNGSGTLIGKLSDEHRIDDVRGSAGETLVLALADRR